MTDEQPLTIAQMLENFRKEKEAAALAPKPEPVHLIPTKAEFAHAVPEVYEYTDEQKHAEQLIEQTIRSITPLQAYKKFIAKEVEGYASPGNLRISCPLPEHRDAPKKNAGGTHGLNATLHEVTGQWKCFKCDVGGDMMDLASIGFGRGPKAPGGADFHRLREEMAASFGTYTSRGDNGTVAWREDDQFQTPAPQQVPVAAPPAEVQAAPAEVTPVLQLPTFEMPPQAVLQEPVQQQVQPEPVQEPTLAPVAQLHVVPANISEDEPEEVVIYPHLNWREIVPPDTFLHEYMTACCNDDSPEEYHFWHGMAALGHAVGKRVQLDDDLAVTGNLMICLLGGTGVGKSKSRRHLKKILRDVLPFKDNGNSTSGVKPIATPGSGEVLISSFSHPILDPTSNKMTGQFASINGFVDFDELSNLLGRSGRIGSTLQDVLMQMYDAGEAPVTTSSRGGGTLIAEHPFCNILTSTQPRSIRNLIHQSDADSGFLNRWIFAGGPVKKKNVLGGSKYGVVISLDRAEDQYKALKGWGATARLITMERPVYEELDRFFEGTIFPLQRKADTALLARLDLVFKKILLLLTINLKQDEVTLDTLNRAKPIMDYMVQCFALISREIGITTSHEIVGEIVKYMEFHFAKTGKGMSASEFMHYTHRRKYDVKMVASALKDMETLNMIFKLPREPAAGRGRPTDRYMLIGA